MRAMAILTALAMAASTAAYADPPRTYDRDRDHYDWDRDYDRDRDRYYEGNLTRDHYDRYDRSHWYREHHGRWAPITRGNARTGRTDFFLPTRQRYRKIRIEAIRGEPVIAKVGIEFANGGTQVVYVNAALPVGAGEVIDLTNDTRTVTRVIIDANPQSRGQFAVYGA
jgi:hypothetical protein